MTIRPIVIHPDPRLKKVCDPVPDLSDELIRLADDMLETMYDAPGVGLAAPQVGVLSRLIVADAVKDPDAAPKPMVMFNPQVVLASDETNVYEEGCLSIPDQYAEVTRKTLSRPACLFALRIPGRSDYLAALDEAVHRALSGKQKPDESLREAAKTWREITERLDLKRQRQAYWSSLGLD